jgi:hypothetical protein
MLLRHIHIFYEDDIGQYLANRIQRMKETIYQAKEDYILNVNEAEYIDYLYEHYYIEPIDFRFDEAYADTSEKKVATDHRYYGTSTMRRVVYEYHIPFLGDAELLKLKPSTYTVRTEKVKVSENEIIFEIIDYYDDVNRVNNDYDNKINYLKSNANYSRKDVEIYNQMLRNQITTFFASRKQEFLNRRQQLSSLRVPIRKSSDVPRTFSVPTPEMKKKIRTFPKVEERGFTPEPTLNEQTYFDILTLIHDMGKEFERKPSVYNGKEEEHLRDHLLMILEPHFEGSATGETFNKKGKTDILLKHQNNNVFIGECKFWKGKKVFLETITQLLSYLTWRDSKAAVIMFVKNKEFSDVIETVKSEIGNHSNFLGYVGEKDESWMNYRFHLNGDKNREVKLAVMLYHIPKS